MGGIQANGGQRGIQEIGGMGGIDDSGSAQVEQEKAIALLENLGLREYISVFRARRIEMRHVPYFGNRQFDMLGFSFGAKARIQHFLSQQYPNIKPN